jgi:flagellar secretion chaperone FliS
MFGQPRSPAAAYAQVGLQTQVASASPHRLITLLFEGALSAMDVARLHIENHDQAKKGKAISQAIDIIDNGLNVSLEIKAGGDLAKRLQALYIYIVRRLLMANLDNDLEALAEARSLLEEIHSAWIEIAPKVGEVGE